MKTLIINIIQIWPLSISQISQSCPFLIYFPYTFITLFFYTGLSWKTGKIEIFEIFVFINHFSIFILFFLINNLKKIINIERLRPLSSIM